MGFKTISLSEEAYERLASLKKRRESFTEVVLRLCSGKSRKPLTNFAGAWSMSDKEENEIFGEISELWMRYEKSLLGHGLSSSVIERTPRGH